MKTKNNVQKAVLRSVAVVVSFVLISFTVSGQDFWKRLLENSSFNEIALAMVETTNETNEPVSETKDYSYLLLENETESALELEDWMYNYNLFGVSEFDISVEAENSFQIENWMLDESLFRVDQNSENNSVLETWMISDKIWNM